MLYNDAGEREIEVNNTMKTWEEELTDLGISHDLDNFQVQSGNNWLLC